MAEALGIATSAISVAGFAGQLAEGSTFLYNFFKDFKNAPEDIRALAQELQIFTLILADIHHSPRQLNAGLSPVLKDCEEVIVKLSSAISDIQPSQNISKPRLWVKQFRAVLKRSDLAKHLLALERAKSTLLQCCTNAVRVDQARDGDIMKAMERSLSDLTRGQISYSTATNDILHLLRRANSDTSALSETTSNIALVTTKTCALAERLTDETLHIQEVSSRIEKATQNLVESTFASQPKLLQLFGQSVKRTIRKSLRRHLTEAIRSEIEQQIQSERLDAKSTALGQRSSQDNNEKTSIYNAQRHSSSTDYLNICADEWVKTSTDSKTIYLMRNSHFGTITITSTTVWYCRRDDRSPEVGKRKASYITVKYLPALWISLKGIMTRYCTIWTRLKTCMHSPPSLSLRVVNIVPDYSDIMEACTRLDLDTVRRLFDEGRASPYDVDDTGRNLLGCVVLGARFETLTSGNDGVIRDAANRLLALVDTLTLLGVDAGEWERDCQSPAMILCSTWLECHPDLGHKFEDIFHYTMNMLLSRAQTDPFAGKEAFLSIDDQGHYYGHPGSCPYFNIHPTAVENLVQQDEWPLSWDPDQVNQLCDLRTGHSIANYVKFWVTCPVNQANEVLQAKLRLLRLLVKNNRAAPAHPGYDMVHIVLHFGGELISLLTEHQYSDGTSPWLRHRFKKTILVRDWMLATLQLLLQSLPPSPNYEDYMNEVSEHARRHNLRTVRIWYTARNECSHGTSEEGDDVVVPEMDEQDTGNGDRRSCGSEWETDHSSEPESNWMTEDEWEEGPMLVSARDIDQRDEVNTQKKRPSGCTCRGAERDYDECYWSHVYDRITWYKSTADMLPEMEEGTLKRFARTACSVASYIV